VNPRALISGWNEFWFEPISIAPLVVFRMAYGLIALAWSLALVPEYYALMTRDGILPHQPPFTGKQAGVWGVLGTFPGKTAAVLLLVAVIVASVFMILGLFPQLAALVLLIGMMSFERRNPYVFNAGDVLLRVTAFYLIFAPTAAALSLSAFLRDRKSFWTFSRRAPWAMRLLQIQLSVVYLFAVWTKAQGTTWNNGTAVSFALRISDIGRFPVPSFITGSALISNIFSYGTLVLELSLAILVWNRKLRPWVLLAGLSLHLGIEYSIRVGFYGMAITSLYLLFVPAAWLEGATASVRRRIAGTRLSTSRDLPTETAPG
jgi:Vitamin K-dependent gamma-carboxylase